MLSLSLCENYSSTFTSKSDQFVRHFNSTVTIATLTLLPPVEHGALTQSISYGNHGGYFSTPGTEYG